MPAKSVHSHIQSLHQVCMCVPLAHHKVCIKCARCRLCRLGAHPSCLWLLGVVSGPAHGPRADVEELAASAWLPVLMTFSQRKEVSLAASQHLRNSAVVPSWNERQPSNDGGDWHNVDDWLLLLIQLLRPALASLPPPRGDSPVHLRNKDQLICTLDAHLMHTQSRHSADSLHTNSKQCTRAPARSKVAETLDHGAVAVHPN
jgi:hypothetical protein